MGLSKSSTGSLRPANSCAYILATREGVSFSPGLSAFSPMPSRISLTPSSILLWSMAINIPLISNNEIHFHIMRRTGNAWHDLLFISEPHYKRAEHIIEIIFPVTQQFIIISFSVPDPVAVLIEGYTRSYHYIDRFYI